MEAVCQWAGCKVLANAHVRYGRPFFGKDDITVAYRTPFYSYHADLCAEHTAGLVDKYLEIHVYELGQCPERCVRDSPTAR
jgi:hypothetical protein